MRNFVVYSSQARTDPFIKDLKKSGRIDVLLHSIISALFISNKFREDVQIHLFLMGPPNSPRHILIKFDKDNSISKKNLKKLIEMCLRRCKEGEIRQVHPGVFVDDLDIYSLIEKFKKENLNVFYLDFAGKNIKLVNKDVLNSSVFILGDHFGFDKVLKKWLRKNVFKLSLGENIYFTSQAITIINYELDNILINSYKNL